MATTASRRGSVHADPGWNATGSPVPGDVLACLEELGIVVRRVAGDEAEAWCPGHVARTGKQDSHPSWSVNVETGVHNCFSCGFKGSFVSLVAEVLDVSWIEATGWVRARGGIERARRLLKKATVSEAAEDTTKNLNEASLALFDQPPADVVAARLLDPDAVAHYGVLWDAKNERWILPIRDPDTGRLWGWQEKSARYFRNYPLDVKKSQALFGLSQFDADYAIVVESPLDVVRLHSVGFHNTGLAAFGAGVSDAQMQLVLNATDTVVMALDADSAGDEKHEQIRRTWASRGLVVRYLDYSRAKGAKDIGDMTSDEIKQAVRSAYSSTVARFR